jgi:hypothetical protein
MNPRRLACAFTCSLISFLVSGLNSAYGGVVSPVTFTGIGFSGTDNYSEVRSVTADGSKAVGTSGQFAYPNGSFSNMKSISWTQPGGFQVLPNPPTDGTTGNSHSFISASDITPDGNWIAYRAKPNGTGALVAMLGAGDGSSATPLGRNGNLSSAATQINDAGNILFGFGTDPNGLFQSFRWTAGGGYQQFTDPVGYNESLPAQRGTSSDGSVSVGDVANIDLDTGEETAHQAYRWTLVTGLFGLGYLPGGDRSVALGVSADGNTVFGISNSTNSPGDTNFGELFLWTSGSGMVSLGKPAGYDEYNNVGGMATDASVLVASAGDSTAQNPDIAFIYPTASHIYYDLGALIAQAGAAASIAGWSELTPFGVSDDGTTLFGSGTDPNGLTQGWVAHFPAGYLRNVKNTAITSVSRIPSGPSAGNFVINGTTLPNASVSVHTSPDLVSGFGAGVGTATANSSGLFSYTDSGAAGLTKNFYKVTLP